VLVGVASNDKVKDFPLARRQCRDMSANDIQLGLRGPRQFMMRNRPLDCLKKNIRWYRLGQKVIRTRLDGPYRGRDVEMPSEEYDRQCRAEFVQPRLQGRTVQVRHPQIEENATRYIFAG
jgi:hypothetical protein